MKKILLLIVLAIFSASTVSAQLFKKKSKTVEPKYQAGAVTVTNGKVVFEETIAADGLTAEEIEARVNAWMRSRFVEPTVISAERHENRQQHTLTIKSEEYIVFKSTALVLNRTRIYYTLTVAAKEGSCNIKMSQISYWHDEEGEKGGIKDMKAEEWITDKVSFDKKGRLKKFEGRFRSKTIDLKDTLVNELKRVLNSK